MNNQLMLWATGAAQAPRQDRALAAQSQDVYNQVRLAALQADGSMALAGHMMEGVAMLEAHRRALSVDQPTTILLGEIQINAVRSLIHIQQSLYGGR